MNDRPRRIEVAIDELVLHGFDPRDRRRIAEAVRSELCAALDGWSPVRGARVAHLEGGTFAVPPTAVTPPAAVGQGVAGQIRQALHEYTGRGPTPRRAT